MLLGTVLLPGQGWQRLCFIFPSCLAIASSELLAQFPSRRPSSVCSITGTMHRGGAAIYSPAGVIPGAGKFPSAGAVSCLPGAGSKAEAMQGCCLKPRGACVPSIWAAQGFQRSRDPAHGCREF